MKSGYQQADAVMKTAWRDCDISDLCQLQRGFDITEATRKPGDVPVYSSSGLSYFHNEAKLQPPSVITGRKGILGKVFYVQEPCWPHDTTLWVKDFKGNDPRFVWIFLGEFKLERFDAATSVPTLNRNNLVGIPIVLPAPPEQRIIAEVLSDVDGLLDALDRLISKKRDLKQAAMQQLLSGKTRLPGFQGEWSVAALRQIVAVPITDGPHLTPKFLPTGIPFLSVNNLVENKLDFSSIRFISEADHAEFSKKCKPKRGDILFGKAASVGMVALIETDDELNIWSPLAMIRVGGRMHERFVYYALQTSGIARQIKLLTNASSQGNIGMSDIGSLEIPVPPIPEQTAIAQVLSDMDAELATLEQRRDKTRAIKQGMMQELLTGKTRLV